VFEKYYHTVTGVMPRYAYRSEYLLCSHYRNDGLALAKNR
jgi:hypothetical protein